MIDFSIGKAKQHELKLVTARITAVELMKMEQRNDFYVKFYFDVDDPEYSDLCKYKIYHLTSEGAAKHLYGELMNIGLRLQESDKLESVCKNFEGETEITLVEIEVAKHIQRIEKD